MNEIKKVKIEVKLRQWAEMIHQRQESGLKVSTWCKQNGINLKTYYYRLKRVRQAVCHDLEQHDIVPIEAFKESELSPLTIELCINNVRVIVPDDFNADTLRRLLEILK